MPIAYGIGGLISVPQGAIRGNGPPPASFKGDLGQFYFDVSVSPPEAFVFDGQTWQFGANNLATTTTPGIVLLDTSITGLDTDDTVPTSKAVFDLVLGVVVGAVPAATELTPGIAEIATQAETNAGVDDARFVTPLKLATSIAGGVFPGSFTTLSASGLITGTASATITTGATALNLGTDASTGAINIGTGAGARAITIGNITGATSVAINTGTGNFAVTTTGAGDVVLNSGDTVLIDSVGVLELNSSAGVISIGNDAVAQNINIGTGASARVITLGNSSGATTVTLNAGTGGVNVGTNAIAHTITIGNITGATAITHNSGTGANVWTTTNAIWTLNTGTGSINIGTDAAAKTITIGNITGATAVVINSGTGASSINTTNGAWSLNTGTGAINLGTDAAAKTITIGNSTGATSVVINSGTGPINIGTNAIAHTVTIGNITGATAVNINAGTGGSTWTTTNSTLALVSGTGAINIGTDAAAKIITIGNITGATAIVHNSGTGANVWTTTNGAWTLATGTGAINVSADAAATTVNLGTGAGAKTVALGSTNTTSTTTINSGTGGVNVVGNLSLSSVATKISMNGGAVTDFIGQGTLIGGTLTIANTNIAATDRIMVSRSALNASPALGFLISTIIPATSFTVASFSATGVAVATDVSSFDYVIFRQT